MDHQVHGEHHRQETHLTETDESLAARAACDPAALAELYSRHLPGIYQYCRYRLGDPEQAEDVCGVIFLKMVEGLGKRTIDRFRPWLYTIAHHEVVTAYRMRRPHVPIDLARDTESPAGGPEDLAMHALTMDEVLRSMSALGANERSVLELRLAGLGNPEIGKVLGKSQAWVRTTQHRAIVRLRARLSGGREQR